MSSGACTEADPVSVTTWPGVTDLGTSSEMDTPVGWSFGTSLELEPCAS